MDFTKHANDRKQCVFLKLSLQFDVAGKVLLEQLVLDERECGRVKLFDQFVYELERKERDSHLTIHVVLKHQIVFVLVFDKRLWLLHPLVYAFKGQKVLEKQLN